MASAEAFTPSRLVVLSELSAREKDRFYRILVEQDAKFHVDRNRRIVSNVRLLGPNAPRLIEEGKVNKVKEQVGFQQRLARLSRVPQAGVHVTIKNMPGIDYTSYRTFVALASEDGETVTPKKHVLTWVMRLVEDFYDARFTAEKINVERDPNQTSSALMDSFPVFVVKQLCTLVGLKPIVDQFCWDLLYNAHIYRRDYLEMEIFMRFVQEFYDNDDLLFFLYARSVVAKVLRINYKRRWCTTDGPGRGPKALWMSFKEAVAVSKIIFGVNEDNRTLLTDFMSLITQNLVGQKTEKVDSRRIDITQYLHLAVVGYHQFQAEESMGGAPSGRGTTDKTGPQSLRAALNRESEDVDIDQEHFSRHTTTLDELAASGEQEYMGQEGGRNSSRLAEFLSTQESENYDYRQTGEEPGGKTTAIENDYSQSAEAPPLAEQEQAEEGIMEAWQEAALTMNADEQMQEALQMVQLDHESEFLDMLMAAVTELLNDAQVDEVLEYLTETLHLHINEVYVANFRDENVAGVEDFQECLERIINDEDFIDAICNKRDEFCAQYPSFHVHQD